jgi:hypothetical protein
MYSQQRPGRFAPLSDPGQNMRVSDAERQAVADRLAGHFADGRLDQAEFDERVGRAMGAKTRADLAGLEDDLPGTGAPAGPPPTRRRRRPLLAIVLIVLIAMSAGHAMMHLAAALAWAVLLTVVLIIATRAARRARHDQ